MTRAWSKLTYANVMATLGVFVALGGVGYAATKLPKNSVGTKQLKANAVTAAKIKAGAVTGAKIATGAIDASKLAPGVIPAEKAAVVTLPPGASAPPETVKGSHGTLRMGEEATILQYGPFAIVARCEEFEEGELGEELAISSSSAGSAFVSSEDSRPDLGPDTELRLRDISPVTYGASSDDYSWEDSSEGTVSASSAGGQAFNGWISKAEELRSHTCWYWLSADLIS